MYSQEIEQIGMGPLPKLFLLLHFCNIYSIINSHIHTEKYIINTKMGCLWIPLL